MTIASRIVLQKSINSHSVVLRAPEVSDAIPLTNYWFGQASAHLHPYTDLSVMGTKDEMLQRMEKAFASFSETGPWPMLIGDVDGRPSGAVLINCVVPDEEALVHVHIWDSSLRRTGIASALAADVFRYYLAAFNLKKLLLQVPAENTPVLRLLESIGMKADGVFWGKAAPICKEGDYFRFSYSVEQNNSNGVMT